MTKSDLTLISDLFYMYSSIRLGKEKENMISARLGKRLMELSITIDN